MNEKKKPHTSDTCTASKTIYTANHTEVSGLVGWRYALSAGNGSFRINGTYDAPADARRQRRMLERAQRKAIKKGARK